MSFKISSKLTGFIVLGLLVSGTAFAEKRTSGVGFDVEPVVGYERNTVLIPTSHTVDRMLYGARVSFGVPLLSAEAEYLHGSDSETIGSTTYTDTDEMVKVGLRSQINLNQRFSLYGRAGGQGTRNTHVEVSGTVTSTTVNPISYKPYAGVGLRMNLFRRFYLTAGLTVVFKDFPATDQNEYQGTVGFVVHLP